MRFSLAATATVGAVACAAPSLAGPPQATFTLLDLSSAYDVTVDQFGRTLVLVSDDFAGAGPVYIYENGTYDYIGDGLGRSLSTEATALAGNIFNIDGLQEAARWSDSGGWEGLGQLPNGLHCPSISSGYAISGDGSIVVGLGWDGCSGRAFKWAADAGMVEMEALATGGNRATVISKDGHVAAGFAGTPGRTPAYWNVADGSGQLINVDAQGEFGAINNDGSVLAGRYFDDSMSGGYLLMCRWTAETGIEIIPSLPDYPGGYIHDMTGDGTLLVGSSGILIEGLAAIIWREDLGTVDLRELLLSYGVLAVQDVQLWAALAITEDGRTVVGYAYVPDEEFGLLRRAFVATLPEIPIASCEADLDGDGQVGFTDLTQLLGTWGPCPGCPEDLDGDGQVGFTDLTQLLGSWGPCN